MFSTTFRQKSDRKHSGKAHEQKSFVRGAEMLAVHSVRCHIKAEILQRAGHNYCSHFGTDSAKAVMFFKRVEWCKHTTLMYVLLNKQTQSIAKHVRSNIHLVG